MEFVWVEGGCYEMGCGSWTDSCDSDEKPVHKVCVDGFWMGKYEVTFEQYDRFCEETGRRKPGDRGWGRGRRPVINVSWNDARAFAKWLSRKTGRTFRLPTEAEWEYACRSGGKKVKYVGTSDTSKVYRYANFCDMNCKYGWKISSQDDGYVYTAPAGSFAPNGLGLHDMSGNVWEWCEDVYDKNAYRHHSRKNPIHTDSGSYRVARGSSWIRGLRSVRCANRDYFEPGCRCDDLGFRLVSE
ncbi:formylglycine-generating enzyme family protein [Desulfothermus naphthae]